MRKVLSIVVIVAVAVGVLIAAVATYPKGSSEPPAEGKKEGGKGEEPQVELPREQKIVFEVEKGKVFPPFELSDDPNASGGKCAEIREISPVPEGQDEINPAFKTLEGKPIGQKKIAQLPRGTVLIPNGKIEVPFETKEFPPETKIKEGEYVFWARCWFSNSCADSFYFSIDRDDPVDKNGDGDYDDTGDLNGPEEMAHPTWKVWKWVEFRSKTFRLKPGKHVLKIFNREDGIKIDQFLLALVDPATGDREDAYYPVEVEEPTQ